MAGKYKRISGKIINLYLNTVETGTERGCAHAKKIRFLIAAQPVLKG